MTSRPSNTRTIDPAVGAAPTPAVVPIARTRVFALAEVRWAAASTVLFLLGLALDLGGLPAWTWWTAYLACYACGGWQPGWDGLRALARGTLDVDVLMVVAAIGAATIGQVRDGGLLIVIFATSGALEALATRRTADSVRGLLDLAPPRATRVDRGFDGVERTVEVDAIELAVGDEMLIRPGERIGADGAVLSGASEVDQASITGEPLPVSRTPGDPVYAGTVNGTGTLRVRVGRPAHDSVVARIVAMVEAASATKARRQLFVEKVERRYSVGVVVATLALFAVPTALGEDLRTSLLRAMTFMIVASPCAVVLATMPPLLSAIANAGRHGVLVKSAVVMERLADTTLVALDKTGTLTTGVPTVVSVIPTSGGPAPDDVLAAAVSAERDSEHPLGRAVVAAGAEAGIRPAAASRFRAAPGFGVSAEVDGRVVRVGRLAYVTEGADAAAAALRPAFAEVEARGHTAVAVSVDGVPVGTLALADRIRPDAAGGVARLTELTGSAPVLLTGDNARSAAEVAGVVGITDVRAGLLPEDKVAAVRELESGDAADRGESGESDQAVVLVGDGVNDAPALAAAHTGVAMGGIGSDLSLRTADVIVVRDELTPVAAVIALARRARRVVVANLVIAATIIAVLVAWDLFGDLPLPLGVAGHEGSTVLVGLNGLRLLRSAAWRRARAGRPAGNAGPTFPRRRFRRPR